MRDNWQELISCALECHRCSKTMSPKDQRILSVYDHHAICLDCKKVEEKKPDFEQQSKSTIGQCMAETELLYGDPEGYCYFHFYPYTCEDQ